MAERRQVPRYLSDLKAQIENPLSSTSTSITVVTMSIKGACIEGGGALNPHQKCQLRIDWQGKQFLAQAEVIWKKKEGRTGLKFLSIDKQSEQVLREICATLQIQPLAPLPKEDD